MKNFEELKATLKTKMEDAGKSIKTKAQEFWEDHSYEIVGYGVTGLTMLVCGLTLAHQINENKKFDKEVEERYGEDAVHGSWLGGSAKKRKADLEIWEKGDRKTEFDRVMDFARTLTLGPDEYYAIEGCIDPEHNGTCVTVFQTKGTMYMYHGEVIR